MPVSLPILSAVLLLFGFAAGSNILLPVSYFLSRSGRLAQLLITKSASSRLFFDLSLAVLPDTSRRFSSRSTVLSLGQFRCQCFV